MGLTTVHSALAIFIVKFIFFRSETISGGQRAQNEYETDGCSKCSDLGSSIFSNVDLSLSLEDYYTVQ